MEKQFPGLKKCLALMRTRDDAQAQEDGFHLLLPHTAEHVQELIEEFKQEKNHGLRCWLLELIGSSRSPDSLNILAENLFNEDDSLRHWAIAGLNNLGTKEARTILWEARTYQFQTPEQTNDFRSELETILKNPKQL